MQDTDLCGCGAIHQEVVDKVKNRMPNKSLFSQCAALFEMFSDGTRVQILYALAQHELCVRDIAILLSMSDAAISHHLKVLRMSNLVKSKKVGKAVHYSLADEHVMQIVQCGFEHIQE